MYSLKMPERVIWVLFTLVAVPHAIAQEETHPSHHAEKNTPAYYQGPEPFEAQGRYDLILAQTGEDRINAKKEVARLFEQHQNKTYQSKSASAKNEIYFDLQKSLPAGSIFRVVSAKNIETGDIKVQIETKQELDKNEVLGEQSIVAITESIPILRVRSVSQKPDESVQSIPAGWTKDKGYAFLLEKLIEVNDLMKVSIVFENIEPTQEYWTQRPYGKVVRKQMVNAKGGIYGFGYSEGLVWWTQDIDREQAIRLFNEPLVKNLIPK